MMIKKVLVVLLVLFFFSAGAAMLVVKLYKHPSGSMRPSIGPGEMILLYKYAYRGESTPARGDVVVFAVPEQPGKQLVKRVVAVAGERVGEKGGVLTINGKPAGKRLAGPCQREDKGAAKQRACVYFAEQLGQRRYRTIRDAPLRHGLGIKSVVVEKHHVYVLGDNRDSSMDSRNFGAVHHSAIIGRVLGK